MMSRCLNYRQPVSAVFVLALMFGCQNEPVIVPTESNVPVPDQFQIEGKEWKKQPTLQDADTDCLTKFFGQHKDLAGSPELEGTPVLFTSGASGRRFYWIRPTADGIRWRCVHSEKRKFAITDGTNNPFE